MTTSPLEIGVAVTMAIVNFDTGIERCSFILYTDATVSVRDGCATAHVSGDSSSSGNPTIPEIRWMETPSVVRMSEGEWRLASALCLSSPE